MKRFGFPMLAASLIFVVAGCGGSDIAGGGTSTDYSVNYIVEAVSGSPEVSQATYTNEFGANESVFDPILPLNIPVDQPSGQVIKLRAQGTTPDATVLRLTIVGDDGRDELTETEDFTIPAGSFDQTIELSLP